MNVRLSRQQENVITFEGFVSNNKINSCPKTTHKLNMEYSSDTFKMNFKLQNRLETLTYLSFRLCFLFFKQAWYDEGFQQKMIPVDFESYFCLLFNSLELQSEHKVCVATNFRKFHLFQPIVS